MSDSNMKRAVEQAERYYEAFELRPKHSCSEIADSLRGLRDDIGLTTVLCVDIPGNIPGAIYLACCMRHSADLLKKEDNPFQLTKESHEIVIEKMSDKDGNLSIEEMAKDASFGHRLSDCMLEIGFSSGISLVMHRAISQVKHMLSGVNLWDYEWCSYWLCRYSASNLANDSGAHLFRFNYEEPLRRGLVHLFYLGPVAVSLKRPQCYRENDQIHRIDGPAIEWPNSKEYFVRGVSVPGNWIENRSDLNPKDFFNWPDAEQRRVLFEDIIGWDKVISTVKHKQITEPGDWRKLPGLHESWLKIRDEVMGYIVEVYGLPDSETGSDWFLRCECPSSGRKYSMPIGKDDFEAGHYPVNSLGGQCWGRRDEDDNPIPYEEFKRMEIVEWT